MAQPRVRKYQPNKSQRRQLFFKAGSMLGGSGVKMNAGMQVAARAYDRTSADDYAAFEREFMRIVESEAARKIIEEGL